ncbi:MAG: hypothetical protein QY318_02295 [Candidatus Dojkabacteria bacterium]|nr:MAG: hypothetical protein QY318_02295 [Candidatus Dojkabacteria bacterium]
MAETSGETKREKQKVAEKILPQIRDEVMAVATEQSAPTPVAPPLPVVNKTKRTNDLQYFQEDFSKYLRSIIQLRDKYANRLYALLVFEIAVMFLFVMLAGLGVLELEQWLVLIVAESIIVKTFLTIQIIVKNLFPNKNLLELLIQGSGRSVSEGTSESEE